MSGDSRHTSLICWDFKISGEWPVVWLVGESVTGPCRGGYLTRLNTTANVQPQATRTNSVILSWTELSRSRICSRDGLPPALPPSPLYLAGSARQEWCCGPYLLCCNPDSYLYLQFSKSVWIFSNNARCPRLKAISIEKLISFIWSNHVLNVMICSNMFYLASSGGRSGGMDWL